MDRRQITLAVLCALVFCLGASLGWARQNDKPAKPSDKPPQQAAAPQQAPQDNKPSSDKPTADKQAMRGLDEQIQEIKSDVLGIASELSRLEEKLIYPSGTQVAVFVALAQGDPMRLDAVRLQIDGQLVAQSIYSFKELEALRKGGVQRLYVGNVATGDHKLEVLVEGKRDNGTDFSRTEHFSFRKDPKPKLLELTLTEAGNAPITLGEP